MAQQVPLDSSARADAGPAAERDDGTLQIAPDLAYRRLAIVNVVFFGRPGVHDREWVLVDSGLYGMGPLIRSAASERFGPRARPAAIVLTHGHFDHVGSLETL